MVKSYSIQSLRKLPDPRYQFTGEYKQVFGNPTISGFWIVYGEEKMGKSFFSLKLAEYFSKKAKTLYVSAEEGIDGDFRAAIERANLDPSNKNLTFCEKLTIEEIDARIRKKQNPKVFIIDNTSAYESELTKQTILRLKEEYKKDIIFIFIAHEEEGKIYTAAARTIKRFAKVIVRVEGMAALVSGRVPGGTLKIDYEKALLYHGTAINQ